MTAQTLHAFAVPFNSAVLTSGGQVGPCNISITRSVCNIFDAVKVQFTSVLIVIVVYFEFLKTVYKKNPEEL